MTLIPEGERTIDHRLQVVLVGKGARVLAQRAVDSEINEAYRPRKLSNRNPTSPTGSTPLSPHSEIFATPNCESGPSGSGKVDSRINGRRGSFASVGSVAKEEDDHLVLFTPIDPLGNSLARVRLAVIEGFSASMPTVVDENTARDMCVAILHWRPSADASLGVESVGATTAEFNMRVAEMCHGMRFLPLSFLLSINEAAEDSQKLEEVVSKRPLKDGRRVNLVRVEEDSDECILEAIQDLVKDIIKERGRAFTAKASRSFDDTSRKTRCCAIS